MRETDNFPSNLIHPPPLKKGDTIGLIAPAGPLQNKDGFVAGVKLLREAGFEVKFSPGLELSTGGGYLAGTDRERVDEFHKFWADPEVKALVAVRGGYGSLRIAEALDMNLIRRQPKILVGFSDISVLLTTIFKKTGLVTFHGPVLTSLIKNDRESIQLFFETITGRFPSKIKTKGIEILKAGQAKGRLVGGNLTSLVHLLASPHELSWDNAILFIEDVGEAPYRIDRMLTHLYQAKRLDNLAGLLLGSFRMDMEQNNSDENGYDAIWNRVLELFSEKNIPVWGKFPVGHGLQNYTLPLGIEAEMDSSSGSLMINSPATFP